MPITFAYGRHCKFKVIYIPWQSSYSVIGNVFYCSTWHLLTPFLKNLEMKVSHSVYQEQNQIKTSFWKNDQEILVHHYFPYLMVPSRSNITLPSMIAFQQREIKEKKEKKVPHPIPLNCHSYW